MHSGLQPCRAVGLAEADWTVVDACKSLQLQRWDRRDAPGTQRLLNTLGSKQSGPFHARREPRMHMCCRLARNGPISILGRGVSNAAPLRNGSWPGVRCCNGPSPYHAPRPSTQSLLTNHFSPITSHFLYRLSVIKKSIACCRHSSFNWGLGVLPDSCSS